jgi:hypothetical protein
MIRNISRGTGTMVEHSTTHHEIKCSNQASCHLSFGENTKEKDAEKMASGSNTMAMYSTTDPEIKGLNKASCLLAFGEITRGKI